MKKKIVLPAVAAVIGGAILGVGIVSAQTNGSSNLAQMIAQKFGLNESQVQTVINQYKSQQKANMQTNMQNRLKNKLDQEVNSGKLTSTQEQAIITELQTLQNKYIANVKSQTPAQRKQTIQDMQNELKSWASSQNINLSLIPGFGKMGMGKGPWMEKHPLTTPSASPSSST